MNNPLDFIALDHVYERSHLHDIALQDLHLVGHVRDRLSIRDGIENNDLLSRLNQMSCQMSAQKPGAPSNQNSHMYSLLRDCCTEIPPRPQLSRRARRIIRPFFLSLFGTP